MPCLSMLSETSLRHLLKFYGAWVGLDGHAHLLFERYLASEEGVLHASTGGPRKGSVKTHPMA